AIEVSQLPEFRRVLFRSLSIGNFDGVPVGHRRILAEARRLRGSSPAPVAVVTFEPHPLTVLRPEKAPPRLTPPLLKRALLEQSEIGRASCRERGEIEVVD